MDYIQKVNKNENNIKINKSTSTTGSPIYIDREIGEDLISNNIKDSSNNNISIKDLKLNEDNNNEVSSNINNFTKVTNRSFICLKKANSLYFNNEKKMNDDLQFNNNINNINDNNNVNNKNDDYFTSFFQPFNKVRNRNILFQSNFKNFGNKSGKKNHGESNIIDINKEFIKNIKEEIKKMNLKNNYSNIKSVKNKKILSFDLIKKKEKEEDNMKKISEISPLVYTKIIKSKEQLPSLFKKMHHSIESNLIKSSKNELINLKYVLLLHNSTVRKSLSQFKVKNYSIKKSIKLNKKSLYSSSGKSNNKINNLPNSSSKSALNFFYNPLQNYKDFFF